MSKTKRTKSCATEPGKRARRLIGKVTDVADLRLIAQAANARARKVLDSKREAEALEAWLAMGPGLYRVADHVLLHSQLTAGALYEVTPYRGRKHKGFHCKEKGSKRRAIYLSWRLALDVVPATDGDADEERREQHERMAGMFGG